MRCHWKANTSENLIKDNKMSHLSPDLIEDDLGMPQTGMDDTTVGILTAMDIVMLPVVFASAEWFYIILADDRFMTLTGYVPKSSSHSLE